MISCKRFLAALWGAGLVAWLGLAVPARAPAGPADALAKVTLTLLGTTDIHGNIEPLDYYTNQPANRGLAKMATLIRAIRDAQPVGQRNVLLLDSGDTIQGTPLAYQFARRDTSQPNPTIAVMNAMGYEAMACGNHEFNYGLQVLWKAKGEAKFPLLAANLKQQYKTGVPYFRPYIIKSVGGVRVAIVGFITPGVPRWEIPANYRGYQFEAIVDAAKRVIPEVRKQADLVVVIAHSGLGPDPEGGQQAPSDEIGGENAMLALAEQVPGIDVILFGHTHQELAEKVVHSVLLVQAKNWAQSLARVDVEMQRDAEGRWRVASKHSTTIPVTDAVPADPEISKLAEPYEKQTQAALSKPIATSAMALDGLTARYEDHPLVDLIHTVQMEAGHADVSLATMFYPPARIPAGQVTIREIFALYIYSNTLYTVQMSGAQLKEALEHAASFYSGWPLQPGENLRLPGYNADSAEGVSYTIDLRQPAGQRIRYLTYQRKPLDPAAKLRVAINNYRYTGGGHYDVFKGLPIVYRSSKEIGELLIDYVARTHVIPTQADGNWRIEPPEAREAFLRAARTGADRTPSSTNSSR